MTKNKLKLSLIDDYVKIMLIKNFLNNNIEVIKISKNHLEMLENCKKLDFSLEKIYSLMFKKLNLNDESFICLKQQLVFNNNQFEKSKLKNFVDFSTLIENANKQLNLILNNLTQKSKLLKVDLTHLCS